MVSIPCSYPAVTSPPRLTQFSRSPGFYLPTRFHRHRLVPTPVNSIGDNSSGAFPPGRLSSPTTLFPGGFKRPEIKIPSLVLRLQAEDVLGREDAGAALREAVSRGVRIVVLEVGEQSGGQAYEAACILKSAVGDRAHLLIAERVDVAAAAGASGVLLSDQGIPAIVARNMMMKSNSDNVFLPIVARDVHTAISANNAAISDGADFIIMGGESGSWKMALGESFIKNAKVPIFFRAEFSGGHVAMDEVPKLLQSGVSGIVISLNDLKLFNDDFLEKMLLAKHGSIKLPQDGYAISNRVKVDAYTSMTGAANGFAGFLNLNDKEIKLLEVESLLLQEAVAVIRKAAPMMNEVALLVDAASRLKEPFLMVIVGEFNSGKSTVINALLGRKYLKEGVIPTTNEITLLCYSKEDRNKLEQCERNPDGHFLCHLSAPILKNMNLVDTPGTNVILQRQQRLTEEFVPRADLILFVISSDRPLTQSEVTFLQFVQQWKKKILFVLNKLDLYQNDSEIEEAIAFVKENTKKLLNTADVMLYPVSARSALEAKLYASFDAQNYEELLYNDPRWMSSKFHELEKFLFSFLDGSTYTGMERMKLKLDTPVAIAERLLESSERLVMQQQKAACQDLISVKEVGSNVVDYAIKLENESNLWKKRAIALIETAEAQAVNLMESALQLSNVDLIATYVFKGRQSNTISTVPLTSALQNEIINLALLDMQIMLGEYSDWLQSNISREQEICMEQLQKYCSKDFYNEDIKQLDTAEIVQEGSDLSLKVMENFSASAATRLFEQEMREVFLGSFGGLGAAGLSASLLTSILPTTLEDLLALAFCSAGGFLAISSFPARREKAIKKVRKVANGLARTLEDAMREDFKHAIERLKCFVEFVSKPYLDVAQQRIDRLLETRQQVESMVRKLQDLKVEIQDLHLR